MSSGGSEVVGVCEGPRRCACGLTNCSRTPSARRAFDVRLRNLSVAASRSGILTRTGIRRKAWGKEGRGDEQSSADGRARRSSESHAASGSGRPSMSSGRETVETFVLVFLVFLVFGVEAEGFVIPTGSMAPTPDGKAQGGDLPGLRPRLRVNATRGQPTFEPSNPEGRRVSWAPATTVDSRLASTTIRISRRSHLRDEDAVSLPLVPWLGPHSSVAGTLRSSSCPKRPDVRYIKRWSACPVRSCESSEGTSGWVRSTPARRSAAPCGRCGTGRHADARLRRQPARTNVGERPPLGALGVSTGRTGGLVRDPAGDLPRLSQAGLRMVGAALPHVVPDPEQWAALPPQGAPAPTRSTLVTDFYAYNTDVTADGVAQVLGRTCLVTRLIGTYHYNQTP